MTVFVTDAGDRSKNAVPDVWYTSRSRETEEFSEHTESLALDLSVARISRRRITRRSRGGILEAGAAAVLAAFLAACAEVFASVGNEGDRVPKECDPLHEDAKDNEADASAHGQTGVKGEEQRGDNGEEVDRGGDLRSNVGLAFQEWGCFGGSSDARIWWRRTSF